MKISNKKIIWVRELKENEDVKIPQNPIIIFFMDLYRSFWGMLGF